MSIHDDYRTFHRAALETQDVDPVYPVLRSIVVREGWDLERAVRAIFTHVAYYDLGSALTALGRGPVFAAMPLTLPCATERRGHRDPRQLQRHLCALSRVAGENGGLHSWLMGAVTSDDPKVNWENVTRFCLLKIHGNGRWAAYKTAEMLHEVAGYPLAAPDMGHKYSSGPRQGLELLYPSAREVAGRNDAEAVRRLDAISAAHCDWLLDCGLPASLERCETTLCDFHALAHGRYYVGHDWDTMQDQLARSRGRLADQAWTARTAVADPRYLGEKSGWTGVRKDLNKLYQRTGRLEWWA